MPRFVLSRRAQRDLRRIHRYVATESGARRADDLIERVLAVCSLFATQPEAGKPRPEFGRDVRSCSYGPYLVFYRSRGSTMQVIRIIHGRRDVPAAWNEPEPSNGAS